MTARTILASLKTALGLSGFKPLYLVELGFDSGALNLWNGKGDLVVGATTYTGTGVLLGLPDTEETALIVARGITIKLSGVPSAISSLAFSEPYQGRSCVVRFGDRDTPADAAILFDGEIDTMDPEDGADGSVVVLTAENDLAMLNREVQRTYTDQNQKLRFPNDDFFSHVTKINDSKPFGGA